MGVSHNRRHRRVAFVGALLILGALLWFCVGLASDAVDVLGCTWDRESGQPEAHGC